MADFLVKLAIAVLIPAVIWWLVGLGKAPPNTAVYPPAVKIMCILLTLVFSVAAIALAFWNELLASLIAVPCAIGFGAAAADSFVYRLTWSAEGFSVRRLFGESFDVGWSQISSWRSLPSDIFRFELVDHPAVQRFTFSPVALGGRNFIAAAMQHLSDRFEN